MTATTATGPVARVVLRARRIVLSPVTIAIAAALVLGAIILASTGADPIEAYTSVVTGAFGSDGIGDTLGEAIPIVGLALALAIPLRAGLVNLGGDGQLVLGALAAAAVGLYSPFPDAITVVLALLAGMLAGGLWASLAALLETRCGVPLLVSSLLLGYPAMSFVSYVVRFPLLQDGSSIPQTERLPDGVRLPEFAAGAGAGTGVSVGILLIVLAAVIYFVVDHRTAAGYEVRMTGLGARFTAYAGVDRARLTLRLMFASGSIAGLVGAIAVLGFPYRLVDGALTTPGYTWTGLLAALLAAASPIGTVAAGFFFAAMTVGGFGMEQETAVPQQLTAVLQAVIILFLAVRTGIFRKSGGLRRRGSTAEPHPPPQLQTTEPAAAAASSVSPASAAARDGGK